MSKLLPASCSQNKISEYLWVYVLDGGGEGFEKEEGGLISPHLPPSDLVLRAV